MKENCIKRIQVIGFKTIAKMHKERKFAKMMMKKHQVKLRVDHFHEKASLETLKNVLKAIKEDNT